MSEDNPHPSLSSEKAQRHENSAIYRIGLEIAIDEYIIQDSSLTNPREEVIMGAVRLLGGYEVDTEFAKNIEGNLFALAIADAWLSTDKIREKKALLDILKLVVVGNKDGQFQSLSKKVRDLSNQDNPRGFNFDPQYSGSTEHSEYINLLQDYIENNLDQTKTEEIQEEINKRKKRINEKLGINPDQERTCPFVVLNKTADQMSNEIGGKSICILGGNISTMVVLNKDQSDFNTIEHEYAHTQSTGVNIIDYRMILFRGLNEAITESLVDIPNAYPEQRNVLSFLTEFNPNLEKLFIKTYMGDIQARSDLFTKIVSNYGIQAFLELARMSPFIDSNNNSTARNYLHPIYLEPVDVITTLNDARKRRR